VAGHQRYSFLDGFSGYNQVFIQMNDQLKTTFTTEWGMFAFNRMPFGLCKAPGTFQWLMMDIFKDFLRHFLEVFIDDFAVFSNKEDHLEYLRKTFQRCRETNLKLHPRKVFFRNEFRNPARTHRWTTRITSRHGQGKDYACFTCAI
jgi:hypothetical protein